MQTVEKKSNPTTQFPVQFCQKNINLDLFLFENKWCWYYCYKNWTKIEKYVEPFEKYQIKYLRIPFLHLICFHRKEMCAFIWA